MTKPGARRLNYRPWTAAELDDLKATLDRGDTCADYAQRSGRSQSSVRQTAQRYGWGLMQRAKAGQPVMPRQIPTTPDEPPQNDAPGECAMLSNQPLSVEDVAALWSIDLTEWEADTITPNTWAIGAKHPVTGEILTAPLYQTKIRFRRKPGATLQQLADTLLADIHNATAIRARYVPRNITVPDDEAHAFVADLFDLHLGKLGWAEEVGENYDTKIGMECAKDAVHDFLWQAKPYRLEQIILPIGNDFFNADNLIGTTTGGTRQDVDTRFHLMFRRGWQLASWMLHECAQIAPVVVPVVPGNHDRQTAFTLGCVLEAEYRRDPRVTFDNSAAPRKYHEYGGNLLGFTHGDEEKPADLPDIMATEEPQRWARCPYREFHIGHFHHGKEKAPLIVDDKRSVTVRWIRSLSGSDRWHKGRGYLGRRGAEGFVLRKSGGLRAHLFTYPQTTADPAA